MYGWSHLFARIATGDARLATTESMDMPTQCSNNLPMVFILHGIYFLKFFYDNAGSHVKHSLRPTGRLKTITCIPSFLIILLSTIGSCKGSSSHFYSFDFSLIHVFFELITCI
jgi:hypothetical protein